LLSISDHDIPIRKQYPTYLIPYAYFLGALFAFAYMPAGLHDGYLELLTVSLINFGAMGFYVFGTYLPIYAILLFVLILVVIIAREVYIINLAYRKHAEVQRIANDNMFTEMDAIDKLSTVKKGPGGADSVYSKYDQSGGPDHGSVYDFGRGGSSVISGPGYSAAGEDPSNGTTLKIIERRYKPLLTVEQASKKRKEEFHRQLNPAKYLLTAAELLEKEDEEQEEGKFEHTAGDSSGYHPNGSVEDSGSLHDSLLYSSGYSRSKKVRMDSPSVTSGKGE
jgi:hypothetical protein